MNVRTKTLLAIHSVVSVVVMSQALSFGLPSKDQNVFGPNEFLRMHAFMLAGLAISNLIVMWILWELTLSERAAMRSARVTSVSVPPR